MLRYLLTILTYCVFGVQVNAETEGISPTDIHFENRLDADELYDTTLSANRLRGIVSHPLLNHPNIQSFTCTHTPVQFTIQIPYRATRIDWLLSSISGISPANDTSLFLPNPVDSFFTGGKMYYTYPLPAHYIFSETGIKTVGMRYYHPSISNATGSETSSYEVEVVEGPEVKVTVDFDGCTNGLAQLSGEAIQWIMPVNEYLWQVNNETTGHNLHYAAMIKDEGNQPVTFIAIAENGCSGRASTWIEAAPPPLIAMNAQMNACEGQPVEIRYESSISTGHITQWNWDLGNGNHMERTDGAHFMQEYSQPGTYQISVQALSDKGCKGTTAFQKVIVHASPKVNLNLSGAPCVDSTLYWVSTATGSADPISQWHWLDEYGNLASGVSNLSAAFRFSSPQTSAPISHWVTTASGCQSDTIISPPISVYANPQIDFVVDKDTLCSGETLLVSTQSPVSVGSNWSWQLNQKSFIREPPFEFPGKEAGMLNIHLRYKNENGCGAKEVINKVFIAPLPQVDAGPDLKTNKTKSLQIMATGAADAVSYSWLPAHLLNNPYVLNPEASVLTDTKFTLTATNIYGCKSSDYMTIKALENIFIPTAFTPNGDGLNDLWQITGLPGEVNSTVLIYDRFGQVIYQSTGRKHQWDGTKGGQQLPPGTYIYMLDPGDGTEKRKGTITLLR